MQQGEGLKSRSPRQIRARSWHHTAQAWVSGFLKTYKMGIMIPAFIHAFIGQIFIKYLQCIGHCARNTEIKKKNPALLELKFNEESETTKYFKIYTVCPISATERNKAGDEDRELGRMGRTNCH